MKEEKVIVDETFVLKFEDSTQPAKRIKLEPTDPEAKESKVFVDAITQTEALDADLKVEIATQTDRPIVYPCQMCYARFRSSAKIVSRLTFPLNHKNWIMFHFQRSHLLSCHAIKKKDLDSDYFPFLKKMLKGHTDEEDSE